MGAPAWRVADGSAEILVRVTPNASHDAVEGVEARDDGQARLKIRVRAVPEKGKANKAVAVLLAKALGVPRSAVGIVSGETARDKTVRVALSEGVAGKIEALAAGDAP